MNRLPGGRAVNRLSQDLSVFYPWPALSTANLKVTYQNGRNTADWDIEPQPACM